MHSDKPIIIIDFDKTLFKKDSLIEFCKYIFKKKPLQMWSIIPQVFATLLYLFKLIDTKKYKELFLLYLHGINEQELTSFAKEFWANTGMENFNSSITSLFNKKDFRIICISASPEIYLSPITEVYQIELIGTKIAFSKNTYKIIGENCKGEEKVKRLKKYLNAETIDIEESYSDSITDLPLFKLSKKAYLVDENGIPNLLKL